MGKESSNNGLGIVELVAGCRRNDRHAQTLFYDYFKKRLFGICLRYAGTPEEADCIFQDAFVQIFRHIDDLKQPESVFAWTKSIVIRTAINYYHRQVLPGKSLTGLESAGEEIADEHHLAMIGQMEAEILVKVINELPAGYRVVLNLYLVDGYTHREIAEILTISEGTSRSQYARGKSALIRKLTKMGIKKDEFIQPKS